MSGRDGSRFVVQHLYFTGEDAKPREVRCRLTRPGWKNLSCSSPLCPLQWWQEITIPSDNLNLASESSMLHSKQSLITLLTKHYLLSSLAYIIELDVGRAVAKNLDVLNI